MLEGKKGIIFGVANDHSIAWGIAKTLSNYGAELAITYQNDILLKRIKPLASSINCNFLIPCDVSDKTNIPNCFDLISKKWGKVDFVVHAIAHSDKKELSGRYINTSKENFLKTLDISCFSLTAIAKESKKLMDNGGSIISLSFYGSKKVMPNYNVMGVAKAALEISIKYLSVDLGKKNIRINGISASPMRTLSGAVIGNAREIFNYTKKHSPLNRNTSLEEIGNSALYLLSDLSTGVTGEIMYVDCGYKILGMPNPIN